MQSTQNKVHTHDSYITVTFNNYISINGLVIYSVYNIQQGFKRILEDNKINRGP